MKKFLLISFLLGFTLNVMSQSVGIGSTEIDPDPSAALHIEATGKGLLIPRMTMAERDNIENPAMGLIIFQTDAPVGFYFFDGNSWTNISDKKVTEGTGVPTDTNPANPSVGDTYVDSESGEVYLYDGTDWVLSPAISGDEGNVLTQGGDGLPYLDRMALQSAAGLSSGAGVPTSSTETDPAAVEGDIYVDSETGDIYTFVASPSPGMWISSGTQTQPGPPPAIPQFGDTRVDPDTDEIYTFVEEPADSGLGVWVDTGSQAQSGPPTVDNPADPLIDDTYVDLETGDVYTFVEDPVSGLGVWMDTGRQAESGSLPVSPDPGDTFVDSETGDVYTYTEADGWKNQSGVSSKEGNTLSDADTDGRPYLDATALKSAAGISNGQGAPADGNPADPQVGDTYVDSETGDVYTYTEDGWKNQSGVSSKEGNTLSDADTDGRPYLDEAALRSAAGLSSGEGVPTTNTTTDPAAKNGDVYVDTLTGDVYTFVEDPLGGPGAWTSAGTQAGVGAPTDMNPADPQAGDTFVDSTTGDVYTYTDGAWENQSGVSSQADNILVNATDDGRPYLDEAALRSAAGLSSGEGVPTTNTTTDPAAKNGDVYVDTLTGDVYTFVEDPLGGPGAWTSAGTQAGVGAPTDMNPADPQAGDTFVDSTTGDVYTYTDGAWENQSGVSSQADNILVNATDDGRPYLDEAALKSAAGLSSGVGVPMTDGNSDPAAEDGDTYVDLTTGDVYTYTDGAWVNQTDVTADNGLSAATGDVIELGGTLTKPTTIETSDTNTLGIVGLETPSDLSTSEAVVVNSSSGLLQKVAIASLVEVVVTKPAVSDGQRDFTATLSVTDESKTSVYRNGIRVDFTASGATISLEIDAACHVGDEIRIVQIK